MSDTQASSTGAPEGPVRFQAGHRIAHYRIVAHLGSGGMGEVYRAHDTRLERDVALKFLRPRISTTDVVLDRLLHEARAASALSHPNIVSVYAVEEEGEHAFLVMEFVAGATLQQELQSGAIKPARFVSFAQQLAAGLAAAHREGIVHRDLKPSNILVSDSGQLKIMDFGIARPRAANVGHESGSPTSGTPAYMSPEQILGGEADPRSDVFSLGVILYEMATGSRPFGGTYEAALAYAIVHEDPPPLDARRDSLTGSVLSLIPRALSKEPGHRFASGEELLRELELSQRSPRESEPFRKAAYPVRPILIASGVLLAAWALWSSFGPKDRNISGRTRLVVLPFELRGDTADAYFAEGMADAVTTRLTQVTDLGIISSASARQYVDTKKSVAQIGRELDVGYLLRGTVELERSGPTSRVRISPELVRVEDDIYVWKEEYVRVFHDVFELQSDIARDVAGALNIVLRAAADSAIAIHPTENVTAYDLYLRGNSYFNRSWSADDIKIAQDFYERALALDSTFATAWAMLARCHGSMFWEYYDHTDRRLEAARVASERAVQLAPDLAESRLARGYYYYHGFLDYEHALSEFAFGLVKNPEQSELLNAVGAVQRRMGDFKSAVESFRRALEVDPRSHRMAFDVALTYGMMRNYGDAHRYLAVAQEIAPDWDMPYVYKAWLIIVQDGDKSKAREALEAASGKANLRASEYYWWITRIVYKDYGEHLARRPEDADTLQYHLHQGRLYRLLNQPELQRFHYDSARLMLEERVRTLPDAARFQSWLGLAAAGVGRPNQALNAARKAVELLPASRETFDALFLLVNYAEVLVMLGRLDEATQQLAYALSLPGFVSIPYLKTDPLWDPLRGTAAFQALLADHPS